MKKVALVIVVLFAAYFTLAGFAHAGDFYSDKNIMNIFNKKVTDKPINNVKFLGAKKGCAGCAGCQAACGAKQAAEPAPAPAAVPAPEPACPECAKMNEGNCKCMSLDKPCHKMTFMKFKSHANCRMEIKCEKCAGEHHNHGAACSCKAGKATCENHRFHRIKGDRACRTLNCTCDCHRLHEARYCHEVNCVCDCHKGL